MTAKEGLIKMQLAPEIKQQLEEQKSQCIFCKLISGELPGAKKVFEDDKTIALLDIYPALKGHTLFMLKEHYPFPTYASPEELAHKFSLIPDLSEALKSALVKTGLNVFIALGGIAGQQSYHFMAHLIPRENEDKFYNFLFEKEAKINDEEKKAISELLSKVMRQSSSRGILPPHLTRIMKNSTTVYEDERVACIISNEAGVKGQVTIYSKNEEKHIEKISQEDCAYLFEVATKTSQAVFEALKAQGTNILLMSGHSDDNLSGALAIHILPRWQDDSLQNLLWEPKRPSYNLDDVASKIKDKTWNVKYEEKIKKEVVPEKKIVVSSPYQEIINAINFIREKP